MKGKRIPVPEDGNIFGAVENPGDYCGPVEGFAVGPKKPDGTYEQIPVRRVAFILPDRSPTGGHSGVHHCQEPPHKFTEEPDGTLTIKESILSYATGSYPQWHGYLEKGEWRTA